MRKALLLLGFTFHCWNLFAQSNNSNLLFQYFGISENQDEITFIIQVLSNYNLTSTGPEQEKAILEAHNYYIEHKEEIDTKIKVDELLQFRSIAKSEMAAGWAKALGIFASSMTGVAAVATQESEWQKQQNKRREMEEFIANLPKNNNYNRIQQQNFGNSDLSDPKSPQERRQITTSSGYEGNNYEWSKKANANSAIQQTETNEHVNIAARNQQNNISANAIDLSANTQEQIIQGYYIMGGQPVAVKLKYSNGRITAYSTSKDMLHKEQWNNIYPDNPHPTMELQDGEYAREYKYKVSGAGTTFYFNK